MSDRPRVALLHTGAVVIPPVTDLVHTFLPDATAVNYLDDRIVADLADPDHAASVPGRLTELVRAAKTAGAEAVMLTCSSISGFAANLWAEVGIPVLRIDEAMADEAVGRGGKIVVLATLPTTCEPTAALIRERAELAGQDPAIRSVVIDGAFEAVASGDRTTHDRLVGAAIADETANADVIVLAQASMAGAASAVDVDVPVLTSLELGVRRLGAFLAAARG